MELDFSFLETGKTYKVHLIQDANDAHYDRNPEAFEVGEFQIKAGEKMKIRMAEGGGFILKLIEN